MSKVSSIVLARSLVILSGLICLTPALAGELQPDDAKRFIVSKLWNFGCSEGTRGFGRIFANGSVRGTLQESGSGPVRHDLPAGTVSMRPDSFCASVRVGYATVRPCFAFTQTGSHSFRGRVSSPFWMRVLWGRRYCDFVPRNLRWSLAAQ
jgi:hypothetical protein